MHGETIKLVDAQQAKIYLQAKEQNTPKVDKGIKIVRDVKKGKKRKEKKER